MHQLHHIWTHKCQLRHTLTNSLAKPLVRFYPTDWMLLCRGKPQPKQDHPTQMQTIAIMSLSHYKCNKSNNRCAQRAGLELCHHENQQTIVRLNCFSSQRIKDNNQGWSLSGMNLIQMVSSRGSQLKGVVCANHHREQPRNKEALLQHTHRLMQLTIIPAGMKMQVKALNLKQK